MGIITDIIKGLPLTAIQAEKIKQYEKRLEELENENTQLKNRLTRYEEKTGKRCPQCQKQTLNLKSNKPNAVYKTVGGNNYLFSCSECSFSEEVLAFSAQDAWKMVCEG